MDTAEFTRISAHFEPAPFKLGAIVCEAGGILEHAYFPEGCVLSLQTVLENGQAIETANIGHEGAFGLFAAMYSRVSFNRCLVQMEGPMLRCRIEVLQREFHASTHVRNLFVRYSEMLMSQVHQSVACNAFHSVIKKTCRWLLMMHDRAENDTLTYTHDFIAHTLGVDRKSITLAAQTMQSAGLINYHRGTMQVLDRSGLEKTSCECYAVVKERFVAFLNPPAHAVR